VIRENRCSFEIGAILSERLRPNTARGRIPPSRARTAGAHAHAELQQLKKRGVSAVWPRLCPPHPVRYLQGQRSPTKTRTNSGFQRVGRAGLEPATLR
jgi:hypothetical protein